LQSYSLLTALPCYHSSLGMVGCYPHCPSFLAPSFLPHGPLPSLPSSFQNLHLQTSFPFQLSPKPPFPSSLAVLPHSLSFCPTFPPFPPFLHFLSTLTYLSIEPFVSSARARARV
jgi:hypothetical protein